jgi:ribosomal-protein-alanine N-acetyltransferase
VNLNFRAATEEDIPALHAIERASFAQPHWSAEDFLQYRSTIAEAEGAIAAFIVVRDVYAGDAQSAAEREILNLAVAPSLRRRGVAAALLSHELSTKSIYFLEVRESNLAALTLYRKHGFLPVDRRLGYYSNPPETAIVMRVKW